jgi:hypothetical protein
MAATRLRSREQVIERTLEKMDRKALRELVDDGKVSAATKAERDAVKAKRQA